MQLINAGKIQRSISELTKRFIIAVVYYRNATDQDMFCLEDDYNHVNPPYQNGPVYVTAEFSLSEARIKTTY